MNRKFASLVAAMVMLSGCAEPQRQQNRVPARTAGSEYTFAVTSPGLAGSFPENYKALVATWVRSTFLDPFTLRNVAITRPVEAIVDSRVGWLICFTANGRNAYGAYAGQQAYAVIINGGAIVDTFPKTRTRGTTGMPASYERTVDNLNAVQGALALNLCAQGVQSEKVRFEPFPELEGRR